MALKLDMMKVYDRMEWRFLHIVLGHMGFPSHMLTLIMKSATSITYCMIINDEPGPQFHPIVGI